MRVAEQISGFWGEAGDPDSVPICVFPTKATSNSVCDSIYPGLKSEGDKPSLYLALQNAVLALPGGESERVRPLAAVLITGRSGRIPSTGWNLSLWK